MRNIKKNNDALIRKEMDRDVENKIYKISVIPNHVQRYLNLEELCEFEKQYKNYISTKLEHDN